MNKSKWTNHDIPDLTGKVVVITGANSGLGYESVKAFASNGAEVIMACRSFVKGDSAKNEIRKSASRGPIAVMELDLADLESIRNFADTFTNRYQRLDILLNNAGIMMCPYGLTKDGFESQIGTNHLGHFALTGLLMNTLKKTPGSRVVNVSSNAHKYGKMDFNNLLFEKGKGYTPIKAYGRSKLANLLFTYELQRRLEHAGNSTISVAAHPGVAVTNLARYMENNYWYHLLFPLAKFMLQDQAEGALPQIRACVDPSVKGGEYYGPDGFRQSKGAPVRVESNRASHSREDAKRLWEISESLTGIRYLTD